MSSFVNEATDERALVAAAQAGDERAFRELVEPYARALEVHCYRMLARCTMQRTSRRRRYCAHGGRSIASNGGRPFTPGSTGSQRTPAWTSSSAGPRRAEPVVDPYPDERRADAVSPLVDPRRAMR